MTFVVGETVSETFSTGILSETFTRTASYINGASSVWNPVFTDLGGGFYRYSYTPLEPGTFEWAGSSSGGVPVVINLDVISVLTATYPAASPGDYTTLADLKARMAITDTDNDAILSAVITNASRAIDGYCNRRFYQLAATARIYTAECGSELFVDDLVSVSELATDVSGTRSYSTVWQGTDYDLTPDNAADVGFPYTAIRLSPNTTQWFPTWRRGVRVTGTWGWPAVPSAITEATLIQATRLFKRKDAPFGVTGSPELGMLQTLPRLDPDVRALLDPYRRLSIGAI